MPGEQHKRNTVASVSCGILTVSDTRTMETDRSGAIVRATLEAHGHRVHRREIVPDEPGRVRETVVAWCGDGGCQAVLLTGGTGLASRDTTFEAVSAVLDKRLDGFGELFRMLSYEQIGSGAMLSRAVAGVCRGTAVFSMPGSTAAVRLALEKLILPELGHVVWLLQP